MFSRGLAYICSCDMANRLKIVFSFGSLTNTEKRNVYGIYCSLTLQFIYLFIYLFFSVLCNNSFFLQQSYKTSMQSNVMSSMA